MPSDLRADCARCFGLCCVALPFARSVDFAADKAAGEPCGHLDSGFRCGIHEDLRGEGFRGCSVFDCFGAGQHVSQVVFAGQDWRAHPESASQMFAVFRVVRALNELRWYVAAALALPTSRPVERELSEVLAATESLVALEADRMPEVDVDAHRDRVNEVLRRASSLARAGQPAAGRALGKDLVGARLRGRDLRGADLRGALLVAADLRGADLRLADVTGADLRDCRLHGADLRGALFLTQAQVDAALVDRETRLPEEVASPAGWAQTD